MRRFIIAATVFATVLGNAASAPPEPPRGPKDPVPLLPNPGVDTSFDPAILKNAPDELTVSDLKTAGAKGRPCHLEATVYQVVGKDRLLVCIRDSRTEIKTPPVLVFVKCPTADIEEGKVWKTENDWRAITGGTILVITENVNYKNARGQVLSAYLLEARNIGAAAYNTFPEADRPKLIKDWQGELEALKRAIKDDEERLTRATAPKDKKHFERLIAEYKEKFRKHEINDPPYIQKK